MANPVGPGNPSFHHVSLEHAANLDADKALSEIAAETPGEPLAEKPPAVKTPRVRTDENTALPLNSYKWTERRAMIGKALVITAVVLVVTAVIFASLAAPPMGLLSLHTVMLIAGPALLLAMPLAVTGFAIYPNHNPKKSLQDISDFFHRYMNGPKKNKALGEHLTKIINPDKTVVQVDVSVPRGPGIGKLITIPKSTRDALPRLNLTINGVVVDNKDAGTVLAPIFKLCQDQYDDEIARNLALIVADPSLAPSTMVEGLAPKISVSITNKRGILEIDYRTKGNKVGNRLSIAIEQLRGGGLGGSSISKVDSTTFVATLPTLTPEEDRLLTLTDKRLEAEMREGYKALVARLDAIEEELYIAAKTKQPLRDVDAEIAKISDGFRDLSQRVTSVLVQYRDEQASLSDVLFELGGNRAALTTTAKNDPIHTDTIWRATFSDNALQGMDKRQVLSEEASRQKALTEPNPQIKTLLQQGFIFHNYFDLYYKTQFIPDEDGKVSTKIETEAVKPQVIEYTIFVKGKLKFPVAWVAEELNDGRIVENIVRQDFEVTLDFSPYLTLSDEPEKSRAVWDFIAKVARGEVRIKEGQIVEPKLEPYLSQDAIKDLKAYVETQFMQARDHLIITRYERKHYY